MFKIESDFRNANISRTIRFPEKLFDQLVEKARAHDISLNLLVLQCCKYALDNMEEDEPPK
nr:hypothetical protein [Maliibacterium massiliense]